MYNGIILINKPMGFTSFDVVAKSKGILSFKKIGHGGTLDPMATGVLPLFLGRAAKACELITIQDKRYKAKFRLGITTDTLDITGEVLTTNDVAVGKTEVLKAIEKFTGKIEQIPPMYSAIRQNGRRLYDLARQGIEVKREARAVEIYSCELLCFDEDKNEYEIDVSCSKGTYIRTLCDDIGRELGCGATLISLERSECLGFELSECITLEQLQSAKDKNEINQYVMSVEKAFSNLMKIELSQKQAKMFLNGITLDTNRINQADSTQNVAVYRNDGLFLGVAKYDIEDASLYITKLFHLL